MPSIVEILHDDDDDTAGNESKVALQSSSPTAADPTRALKSHAKATRRKITPMTDNNKQADGSHQKKKMMMNAKQQATLQSYFVKAPQASTPSLNNSPKKQPQTTEAATKKPSPPSPLLVASSKSNKHKSSRHVKENFKDIVIGKLYERKSLSHKKITSTTRNDTCDESSSINDADDKSNHMDSMLPTIRPLVTVLAQTLAARTTAQDIEPAESQDESEDSAPGYGALRSQLVQKFDKQTNHDTNVGQAVEDQTRNDGKDTSETKDRQKECVHQENENAEEASDPNAQTMNTTNDDDDDSDVNENMKVDFEAKEALQETPQVHTTQAMILASPTVSAAPKSNQELSKHEATIRKYCRQISELVAVARQGLEDEDLVIPVPCTDNVTLGAPTEFPDIAVPHLVCLLEGSKLPLSELARYACDTLNEAFHGASLSRDVVSAKIKVMASRKPYLKNPAIASGVIGANTVSSDVVAAEDVNMDHMWRWEVILLDLLPEDSVKQVKHARAARRKIQQRFNATVNLLRALDETVKVLRETDPPKEKLDKALAKVNREQEKVLKFEQEAEKTRLLTEAKKQKDASKNQREREKEKKKRAGEERKREKEEAKKKKEEQALSEQKRREKEKEKQHKTLMAFFGGSSAKKLKPINTISKDAASVEPAKLSIPKTSFSAEEFRSNINSKLNLVNGKPFSSLSKRARASRNRKTKRVKMRVFVSARNADDPFAPPAFSEERLIEVRDRNKFLAISAFSTEGRRPPYHGTWSKKCDIKKLARNPFSKNTSLDYDVDSEAEWEEGDDDPGEDIENDAGDDEDEKALDEEGDTRVYNYQDGWLAEDDEISVEDGTEMDDDTKMLLKASRKRSDNEFVPICIVAPAIGGLPIVEAYGPNDSTLQERVDGFPVEEAYKLVLSHHGKILADTEVFLDAFPPPLLEERDGAESNEPSEEDMKAFARFVHHSELVSKSQVVEELRSSHPSITASRAQAHRILDSIAIKQRNPSGGVYWEVKPDYIKNLGLESELKAMVLPGTLVKESKKRKSLDLSESCKPKTEKANDSKKRKRSDVKFGVEQKKKITLAEPGADSASKSKGSATKKKPDVSAASANLMKNFLAKKK